MFSESNIRHILFAYFLLYIFLLQNRRISGTGKSMAKMAKYENKSVVETYNSGADSTLPSVPKKRKFDESDLNGNGDAHEEASKSKKVKVEVEEDDEGKKGEIS